jgi:hypothetical protein
MPGSHVKSAFKSVKSRNTLTNRRIVTIVYFNYYLTGLHICAKHMCDLSSSFNIIYQKACRSYGEQDSSIPAHMETNIDDSWNICFLIPHRNMCIA